MGRGGSGLLRFSRIQPRRVRRCGGRDPRSRVSYPGAISGRLHEYGTRLAICAGVLSRRLLACGSGAAIPAAQYRLGRISREGGHPAQRYTPLDGGPRVDANSAGRRAPGMGPGVGHHAEDSCVYQSHAVAGSAGEMAGGVLRVAGAAPPGDHLRDQPAPAR